MLNNVWKVIVILIIASLVSGHAISNSAPVNEVFIIISPGMSGEDASYLANRLNMSDYGIMKIRPTPPYDYDLFMYQLMSGSSYHYDKIPINESHAIVRGERFAWYDIINQSQLTNLWSSISLFNILIVNPTNHSNAFNPIYNVSNKMIPPCIITARINETIGWTVLNTTLTAIPEDNSFKIILNAYNETLLLNISSRASSEAKIVVNETDVLENGIYYIKFYLVEFNETHITIFFPGTLSSIGWQSKELGEIVGTLPFWFMYDEGVMSQLPPDVLKRWVNESILAFEKTVLTALSRTRANVHLLYYPYYRFTSHLDDRINKSELTMMITESLVRVLSNYLARKPGSTVILINPFQIMSEPSINIPGDRLARGLFNVTDRVSDLYGFLGQGPNLNFTLISIGSETYLKIETPEVEGVGEGVILFTPGSVVNLASGASLESSVLQYYIFMLTQSFNPSIGSLIDLLNDKEKTIGELNMTITELSLRVKELNTTLTNLRTQLSECQSINVNLSTKILSIEDELKKAEELRNQAYTFITLGYLGLVITAVGLTLILTRVFSLKQKV